MAYVQHFEFYGRGHDDGDEMTSGFFIYLRLWEPNF